METQFLTYITTHLAAILDKKLLLAVSAGLDSMALLQLCKQQQLDIAVAHCNFGLRGEESDAETLFLKTKLAQEKIPCHIKYFDTYAYAKEKKVSTQMAARDLRYDWFNELLQEQGYDYILTAHHLNDSAETFLINLSRGTGIKGLMGIPREHDRIVRPLLGFSRKQIQTYASSINLEWKEDSSNASDDYVRNHLRHHAIPALEKANANFLEGLANTQHYLNQSQALLDVYQEELKQAYSYPINSIQGPSGFAIDLNKLYTHKTPDAVLYTLLQPYGFTAWEDIYDLKNAQSGKRVFSESHTILKDRDTLQIMKRDSITQENVVWITESDTEVKSKHWKLHVEEVLEHAAAGENEIFVSKERLNFPLQVRAWREGDYFYPLGLGGKKKLSKFFKDEKLSLIAKEQVNILCSEEDIVWVIGMRPDDRFKVTEDTETILKISYQTYEV